MEEQKLSRLQSLYLNNYKKLAIIPIIILILSVSFLFIQLSTKGYFIDKDVSLKGGISATISSDKDFNLIELEEKLKANFLDSDVSVRKLEDLTTRSSTGITIDITNAKSDDLKSFLEKEYNLELTNENFSIQEVGATLGESFFKELIRAVIFSFLFMSIVVFIAFRKLVPSIGVILTAATDIIATLAFISFLDVKLTSGGIAAFLLLIGYSIDSDMVLTTKLIKRESEAPLSERLTSSIKTGVTMTMTALAAVGVGMLITNSLVIKQIFLIIFVGLIIDLIVTYLGNGPLLIWYLKKHEKV